MNIRLHGTLAETATAADQLAAVFRVVSVSAPYPDRPPSLLVRVYVEIRLHLDATTTEASQP